MMMMYKNARRRCGSGTRLNPWTTIEHLGVAPVKSSSSNSGVNWGI